MNKIIIWQYRNKPKASATIKAIFEEASETFKSAVEVVRLLDIESATGYALDLIGLHVGESREVPRYIPKSFFGWEKDESAQGFDAGEWYMMGHATRDKVLLDDHNFRFMIKARILKNYQKADVGDLVESVQFLFGSKANVIDNYNMTMTVVLPFEYLNNFKVYAIENMDILRRPIGVLYKYFQYSDTRPFGWHEDPSAYGFNEGVWGDFLV